MTSSEKRGLVPKLRFPEFREAGEWDAKLLEDFATIVRGGSPRPIDEYITNDADGLNWLKIGDIDKESKFVTSTQDKVIPAALTKTRVVNPGDLILSNSMSFGRPYILEIQTCIHDGWIAVSEINKNLDRDYLYYLMMTSASQTYFSNNAAGSGVQNLNADIIKLLPISYPNKKEQQKIADCLASLDELITLEAQKLDTLKTHKKGLMQQLFPAEGETLPKLRFPEFREPWVESQLGNLCSSISSGRDQIDPDGAFDLYGSTSVIGKTRSPSFSGERLLVARVGANAGLLTKAKGAFGVTDNTLVVSLNPSINMDFLFHYLGTININRLIFGSGQPLITGSILKNLPIPVPTDSEQQKISACLSSLGETITDQSCKLEAIKAHKKGLMQQLFPSTEEVEA